MDPQAYQERKVNITWKNLAVAILSILMTIIGYLYLDLRRTSDIQYTAISTEVKILRDSKLDKSWLTEVYYRDIKDIKDSQELMLQMHLQQGYKMPIKAR
jgi:hypothetical protein